LKFLNPNYEYSWKRPKTFVNNVILGKMWINIAGEIDITNHQTNDICHVNFYPHSTFSRIPVNKVSAIIKDNSNQAKYFLDGLWTNKIECASVLKESYVMSFENHEKLVLGNSEVLWKRNLPE